MTPEEIVNNRKAVIRYLRENPGEFVKITGQVTDGCNGRCLIGIVCEATGESLDGLSNYDYRIESLYGYAEEAVGTPSTLLWRLNDRGSFEGNISDSDRPTFRQMADYLEVKWGLAVPVSGNGVA